MRQSEIMDAIIERAQALSQTVALPEATDTRTLRAARMATDNKTADIILIGSPDAVHAAAKNKNVSLDGIEIIDPADETIKSDNARLFYELREHKGISEEDAEQTALDPLYCATLLLKAGKVNATVAGAVTSTPNVLRPLFQLIGVADGISLASSCFVMTTAHTHMGTDGAFIYADAGVNPEPTALQLADIAIASAESARIYLQTEPKVAMLSYSTMGSARHPSVQKVVEATRLAQDRRPDLLIEGELQADAAIVPEVAAVKCPGSELQGRANVLIFPDLAAGNIAYKLTQRLAGAGAYGPLLQGLAKVGMDLSRGASTDDICNVIAIAAVRSAVSQ